MRKRVTFQVVLITVMLVLLVVLQFQEISQNNEIKNLNDSIIEQNTLFAKRLDEIERQTKLINTTIIKVVQSITDIETEVKNQAGTISRYSDNERSILKSYTLISAQTNVNERLIFIRNTVKTNDKLIIDVNYVEMLDGEKAKEAAIADGNPEAGSLSNNYYIQEKDKTIYQIVIDPETTMYRLEGALLIWTSLESLLDDAKANYDGLFHIYFVDGKAVYLEEQYRP